MAKSLDIGTMYIVKGEVIDTVNEAVFSVERNCFLQASKTVDTEDTLKENGWHYAKYQDEYYILGEDAIKLKNLLTIKANPEDANIVVTKVGKLRRPMQDGVLNTRSEQLSIAMIQTIIKNLLGQPNSKGEVCCFCVPGDPVDKTNLNVLFHTKMLTSYISSLGYTPEVIPEALSIIFSENPTAEDPDETNNLSEYSGISFSFGAGMCNCCFAWKKVPLINFSVAQSGDWIDKEAAKVAGDVDVSTITRFKETKFDLDKVDEQDMKQMALKIFYEAMIENALNNFATKFNQLEKRIETPMDIIVAGGTSMVPGFMDKFTNVIKSLSLPFKIKSIRHAQNPFYSVANGCLAKALNVEKRRNA